MKILEILTERRKIGTVGERAAARFLRRRGYRILKRNFVAANAEIDLIAEKKDTVAFIEVKTRTRGALDPVEPRPASAVNPAKQRKILRASKWFPMEAGMRRRFDVIEVYVDERKRVLAISHLEGTFDLDSAYPRRF